MAAKINLWYSYPGSPFFGQNVHLSSLPSSKTFLKTTEHFWTKTILSRGGRRKLFNSSLMNKLIRIEWVSEWVSECNWTGHYAPGCKHPWAKMKILSLADFVNIFLSLIKTPTFLDALLHTSPICLWKFKCSSMVPPSNFISEWLSISLFITSIFICLFYASNRDSSTEIFHDYTWVDCPYTSLRFPSPHSSK